MNRRDWRQQLHELESEAAHTVLKQPYYRYIRAVNLVCQATTTCGETSVEVSAR
jgi:hypothetical protein